MGKPMKYSTTGKGSNQIEDSLSSFIKFHRHISHVSAAEINLLTVK
jgi:hypothetical protein